MKTIIKKMSLLTINYLTVLPLLLLLITTNQNKELDRLLSVLKASSSV